MLRARNFHKKEKTLKHLQELAEQRNPDEFYFAMQNSKTKDGVHQAATTKANKYSQDELKLMKTQDVKYMALKAQVDAKKAERMKSSLHFIGMANQNRHTVFVDEAANAKQFDPADYFDTPAELLDRSYNRPRTSQLQAGAASTAVKPQGVASSRKLEKRKHAAYKELVQRSERKEKLAGITQKMTYEKEVMGKGRKRKLAASELGSQQQKVFRWKAERKK